MILSLTYNIYTIIGLKILTFFLLGLYLNQLILRGTFGISIRNNYLALPQNYYFNTKVFLLIFAFYFTLFLLQYIISGYIQNSTGILDIVCHSSSTSNVSEIPTDGGVVVNETTKNTTNSVNVENVHIGPVNVPASVVTGAITSAGNAAISVAGLKLAQSLAASAPSLQGKAAAVATGLVVGTAAIALKNVAAKVGTDTKTEFISTPDILASLTTGNDAMDFLLILQLLHKVQIFLVLLIIYYSAFKFFNPYLVNYTHYLPTRVQNYALKVLHYFKAAGQIYVFIFCLILLASTLLTDHYYDFFLSNIENFIRIYKNGNTS